MEYSINKPIDPPPTTVTITVTADEFKILRAALGMAGPDKVRANAGVPKPGGFEPIYEFHRELSRIEAQL